jgi:hypothetical protein
VKSPAIVLKIVACLVGADKSNRMKLACKAIIAIVRAAKPYESAVALHEALFTSPSTYFYDLTQTWLKVNSDTTPEKLKVRFMDDEDPDYTAMFAHLCEEVGDDNLIIVFDEAAFLTPAQQVPSNILGPLRCLIRLINATKLMGIFLSTSSTCSHVLPGHIGSR